MKKFNKARRKGLLKGYQSRFQGVCKYLTLLSRAKGTDNVESVVDGFYAADLIVNSKNI